MAENRITQLPLEVVAEPDADLAVTQLPLETVVSPNNNLVLTQSPLEVLAGPTKDLVVSQYVIETVVFYIPPPISVTQIVLETVTGEAFAEIPGGVTALFRPHIISAKVDVLAGSSTIASVQATVPDHGEQFTRLLAEVLRGKTVTLKAGFDDLTEAEYATFFTGFMEEVRMPRGSTEYRLVVRDPASNANLEVFHIGTTALSVLLTAGATTITVYDATDFAYPNEFSNPTIYEFPGVAYAMVGFGEDAEIISYTGRTATTFTGVTRGVKGTVAAAHNIDVPVHEMLVLGPAHPVDIAVHVMTAEDGKTGHDIPIEVVDTAAHDDIRDVVGVPSERI
jgi:hypothetical protein